MRALIAVLVAWLGFAGSALAEKRLALVIGNDSYQHIDKLHKARADAKSYADLLYEKGFSVEDRYDLGFNDMEAAVAEFVEKIEPGDKGPEALCSSTRAHAREASPEIRARARAASGGAERVSGIRVCPETLLESAKPSDHHAD
jgi:hypothetical protein